MHGSIAIRESIQGQVGKKPRVPWQSPVKHLRRSSLDCQRSCDRKRASGSREEIERYVRNEGHGRTDYQVRVRHPTRALSGEIARLAICSCAVASTPESLARG